ncbi:MAG: LPXTG cell wall anchor domain-containing protein [Clostridiales bacterium]|jgi:LPXTG-motif cell wall-anchored protein|nr:LPXTG cell wall anchor domain-containing protein [Clostridiales bacterium]
MKKNRFSKALCVGLCCALLISAAGNALVNAQTQETESAASYTAVQNEAAPAAAVDKSVLEAKIAEAQAVLDEAKQQGIDDDPLISDIIGCIALGNVVMENKDATQKEVDEAVGLLDEAIVFWVGVTISLEELNELIEEAKTYEGSEAFTQESYELFFSALTCAREIAGVPTSTPDEIMDVYYELQMALDCLEPASGAVDRENLADNLFEAEIILAAEKEEWFTPESYQAFKEAYDQAKRVFNDRAASQEQVASASDSLKDAVNQLLYTPEGYLEYVKLLIASVEEELNGELIYTESSWRDYANAKANLLAVAEDFYSSQEECDAAIESYLTACGNLTVRQEYVSKLDLIDLIKEAQALIDGEYLTEESADAFQSVVDKAQAVVDDTSATQKQVDEAMQEIALAAFTCRFSQQGVEKKIAEVKQQLLDMRQQGLYDDDEIQECLDQLEDMSSMLNAGMFEQYYDELVAGVLTMEAALSMISYDVPALQNLLQTLVNECKPLLDQPEEYSENSFHLFQTAYNQAVEALEKGESDPEKLLDAFSYLTRTKGALFSYNQAIENVKNMLEQHKDTMEKSAEYTEQSFAAFQTAYQALEDLYHSEERQNIEDLLNACDQVAITASKLEKATAPDPDPDSKPSENPSGNGGSSNNGGSGSGNTTQTGDQTASALAMSAAAMAAAGLIAFKTRKKNR